MAWYAERIRRERAVLAFFAGHEACGYSFVQDVNDPTLAGRLARWLGLMRPMQSVGLHGPICDDDLWVFDDIRGVKEVMLVGCPELTDAAILHLIQRQPELETFKIGGCPRITAGALKQLVRLKHLKMFVTRREFLPQVDVEGLERYFEEHRIEIDY